MSYTDDDRALASVHSAQPHNWRLTGSSHARLVRCSVRGKDGEPVERTLDWDDGTVLAVDQCALPQTFRTLRLTTVDDVIEAINRLAIRGAPAIGVAGGLGVALSVCRRDLPGTASSRRAVRRRTRSRDPGGQGLVCR
jgi:hypothetical protein